MSAKEHASETYKKRARANIETKLRLLADWAEKGIPTKQDQDGNRLFDSKNRPILESHPTSPRQFSRWDLTQYTGAVLEELPQFTSHSQDTLRTKDNEDLAIRLSPLLDALAERKKLQFSLKGQRDFSDELKNERDLFKAMSASLATQLVQFEARGLKAEVDLRKELRRHKSTTEELERQLQVLRDENARLVRASKKVSAIRQGKDGVV